jgi:hypothetical protein
MPSYLTRLRAARLDSLGYIPAQCWITKWEVLRDMGEWEWKYIQTQSVCISLSLSLSLSLSKLSNPMLLTFETNRQRSSLRVQWLFLLRFTFHCFKVRNLELLPRRTTRNPCVTALCARKLQHSNRSVRLWFTTTIPLKFQLGISFCPASSYVTALNGLITVNPKLHSGFGETLNKEQHYLASQSEKSLLALTKHKWFISYSYITQYHSFSFLIFRKQVYNIKKIT